MAIRDGKLAGFNEAQAITNAAAASTDILDVGTALTFDLGVGSPLWAITVVTETFVGGTGFLVAVEGSTTSGFTTPITLGSVESEDVTPAKGDIIAFPLGQGAMADIEFLRFYYTPTGTYSAGKVTSYLSANPPGKWNPGSDNSARSW